MTTFLIWLYATSVGICVIAIIEAECEWGRSDWWGLVQALIIAFIPFVNLIFGIELFYMTGGKP